MLSLQFGVSNFGVVITVSAFMFGLGLGSVLGRVLLKRISRPLFVFAVIEIGVAIYALSLPIMAELVNQWLISGSSSVNLGLWHSIEISAALVFLLLPAMAMGLGFPLILAVVRQSDVSLSHLYAANTFGASIGALIPIFLLPLIGWANSLTIIASLGVALGVIFFLISRLKDKNQLGSSSEVLARPQWLDLLCYALIGSAALILQVTWTRLYGMVLLRTEYVLAIILAVFLAGTALGSAVSKWGRRQVWLNIIPIVAALAALVSLLGLSFVSAWAQSAEYSSLFSVLSKQAAMLALVTIVVTFCLGAWLPLLVRAYADSAVAGAWYYGVNALGAGAGALAAGFILMPMMGSELTIIVATLILFLAGMRWCAWRPAWLTLPILGIVVMINPTLRQVDEVLPQAHATSKATLFLHEDAIAMTHVVETEQGQRLLLSDLQRMDASTEPSAVVAQQNQARLPLLLYPDAKSALLLGLGTGISASAALDFDNVEVTAVELSEGAIESARQWFTPLNRDIASKVNIIHDDARRYLMRSKDNYDVIVGDLFHPDMVGRSRLLSVQQFQRAKSRLNEGGIFVQWLALNQFDLAALKIVLNSFQQTFSHSALFVDGFRLAMVGRQGKSIDASELLQAAGEDKSIVSKTGGEGTWTWLARYFGPIQINSERLEDEWRPKIEYHLPRVRYAGEIDLQEIIEWLLAQRPKPGDAAALLAIDASAYQLFERAYLSADAALRSWHAQLQGDNQRSQRFLQFAYRGNPQDQWVSATVADNMLASMSRAPLKADAERASLQRILDIKPDHVPTLDALFQLEQQSGNTELAQQYLDELQQISPLYKPTHRFNNIMQEEVNQL